MGVGAPGRRRKPVHPAFAGFAGIAGQCECCEPNTTSRAFTERHLLPEPSRQAFIAAISSSGHSLPEEALRLIFDLCTTEVTTVVRHSRAANPAHALRGLDMGIAGMEIA